MQKKTFATCNCTDPSSFSLLNSTTCETFDQQTCLHDLYVFKFDENYITSTCIPLCPLECQKDIFKTSISSLKTTGELYYDYIKSNSNLSSDFVYKNLTIDTAKDSFAFVYFFYNSNSYTLTTELPSMDLVGLLANIGGTLGLFLGISLIHICELFDVLINILFIKMNQRKCVKMCQSDYDASVLASEPVLYAYKLNKY